MKGSDVTGGNSPSVRITPEIIEISELIENKPLEPIKKEVIVSGVAEEPGTLLRVVHDYGVRHIVQLTNPTSENDFETSNLILNHGMSFYDKPLTAILNPKEIELANESDLLEFEYVFERGGQKSEMLQKLSEYLQTFTSRQTLINDVSLIADELFTNAVYNAPFVEGKPDQESGASRSNPDVQMPGAKKGRLFCGRKDELLVIGCEDQFGTLHLGSLISRLRKCHEHGAENVINFGSDKGAGIGAYLMYSISNNFYALVEHHKRTVICCGIAYSKSHRVRTKIAKNLHFHDLAPFEDESGE